MIVDNWCGNIFEHYRDVGYVPQLSPEKNCFIFDEDEYHGKKIQNQERLEYIEAFCDDVSVKIMICFVIELVKYFAFTNIFQRLIVCSIGFLVTLQYC